MYKLLTQYKKLKRFYIENSDKIKFTIQGSMRGYFFKPNVNSIFNQLRVFSRNQIDSRQSSSDSEPKGPWSTTSSSSDDDTWPTKDEEKQLEKDINKENFVPNPDVPGLSAKVKISSGICI